MCLGVPGKVVKIDGMLASIDCWGTPRTLMLDLLDEPVQVGDWVLGHLGFARRRVPPEDVQPLLEMWKQAESGPTP